MMRKFIVAVLLLSLAATVSDAETREHFSVVAGGETVGHLVAIQRGNTVDIDYAVSNNGRGPKHKEHLVFGSSGLPVAWSIDGTSFMGGNVNERMSWRDGIENWASQADNGSVRSLSPKLYIANDASPWSLGLYTRIVRNTPGSSLGVLPGGNLKAQKVRHVELGAAPGKLQLDAYILSGVELTPEVLLLDDKGHLFAVLSDSLLVREGYENQYQALTELGENLTIEVLKSMQKRVAHRYDEPIRIRNVHVYDPKSQTTGEASSIVVFRGMITTVESEASGTPPPTDEVVFDAQGGTVVPGLHDMHSHNDLWSGPFYLAAGVTTTRDMGNLNSFLLDLKRRVDAG
jgi:hypothetical protein